MKLLTFPLTVKVEDQVSEDTVFAQLEDAIDPDSWNWDVELGVCTSSVPVEDEDPEDEDLENPLENQS